MQAMALERAVYRIRRAGQFRRMERQDDRRREKRDDRITPQTHGFGEAATTYRLRDWGISRQRFWGSPIPIVYCDTCGVVPEKYENLPVELPDNAPFTGTGESPLAKVPEFYETTCPKCDGPAQRETDTMDTFVDSSWYYFRYTDPNNAELPFDPEIAAYWTPVDQYIGGDDHAVMHLIYTRFWTKVMRDIGLVKFDEPVKRLLTQGMVVGETFFDDATGKRIYYPPDDVTVERDAKGKIIGGELDGRQAAEIRDRADVEVEGQRRRSGRDGRDLRCGRGAVVRLVRRAGRERTGLERGGIEGRSGFCSGFGGWFTNGKTRYESSAARAVDG